MLLKRSDRSGKTSAFPFYFVAEWITDDADVNRDQEADYLENLQSSLTKGTTWERICNTIELQNSQSKTIARTGPGTTDLTRFKEVLLRLKREGDSAPGAAGY